MINKLEVMPLRRAFLIFFLYTLLSALTIQLVILPFVIPGHHLGSGMLDSGDWILYQELALEALEVIEKKGWSYWELRPKGFGLVGIISAIYGATGISKPYILMPLFAIINAAGAISIVFMIQSLGVKKFSALLSAIPFLIFPSSLLWTSQILKEVFSINGSLLIICGIVYLFSSLKIGELRKTVTVQFYSFLSIITGFSLIWIVRGYQVELYVLFLIFILFFLNLLLLIYLTKGKIKILAAIFLVSIQYLIFLYSSFLNTSVNVIDVREEIGKNISFVTYSKLVTIDRLSSEQKSKVLKTSMNLDLLDATIIELSKSLGLQDGMDPKEFLAIEKQILLEEAHQFHPTHTNLNKINEIEVAIDRQKSLTLSKINYSQNSNEEFLLPESFEAVPFTGDPSSRDWIESLYIPSFLDMKLKQLYLQRTYFYFVQQNASSTVNFGLELNSFNEMIKYIPRALQLAFLSPFPTKWFSNGSASVSSLMYLITGFEMIFIYIFIIGALFSMYKWRNKVELWVIVCFSTYNAIYPVYAFPNIGAIFRYRYAGIMMIAALGVIGLIYLYKRKGNLSKI
ncbi:hypothetical protein N8384_06590 [Candidatus Thioglobus sp.]|nr:hypothetical protein [Candidatus Thioglobus sp.]